MAELRNNASAEFVGLTIVGKPEINFKGVVMKVLAAVTSFLITVPTFAQEIVSFTAEPWAKPRSIPFSVQLRTNQALKASSVERTSKLVFESSKVAELENIQSVELVAHVGYTQNFDDIHGTVGLTYQSAKVDGGVLTVQSLLQTEFGDSALQLSCQNYRQYPLTVELHVDINRQEFYASNGKTKWYKVIVPVACD